MSKQITPCELNSIVQTLLICPEVHLGDCPERYSRFMTALAQLVCDHAGGAVQGEAECFDDVWYVGIVDDGTLPEDGGVWADYDLEGDLQSPSVGICA